MDGGREGVRERELQKALGMLQEWKERGCVSERERERGRERERERERETQRERLLEALGMLQE